MRMKYVVSISVFITKCMVAASQQPPAQTMPTMAPAPLTAPTPEASLPTPAVTQAPTPSVAPAPMTAPVSEPSVAPTTAPAPMNNASVPAPSVSTPVPDPSFAPSVAPAPMTAPDTGQTGAPAPFTAPSFAPSVAPTPAVPGYAPMPQPSPDQIPAAGRRVPAKKPQAEQKLEYGPGIDTIDIESGGNWLQKRVIWEDAEKKYEKIKEQVQRIFNERVEFFTKRSAIDKELNLFYVNIGFAQGEFDEILEKLLEDLEGERKQQGALTEQERDFRQKLLEKKGDLEQLKADIKSISDLDGAIDNSLTLMVKQIDTVMGYEKQAWEKFKDIGQELDDKKAKEDYLHIEASAKNIEAIEQYIKGPFVQYFDTVLQKVREYMLTVKSRIEALKKSGIELKKKFTDIEAAERVQAEQERLKKEQAAKKAAPRSWMDYITPLWQYPVSWVTNAWNSLSSWIFGVKKPAAPVKPITPSQPASPAAMIPAAKAP